MRSQKSEVSPPRFHRGSQYLFWLLCFCVVTVLNAFPSPLGRGQSEGVADSTAISQKYVAKQLYLKQQYDARVDELIKSDPVLNQIRGASQQLEIEKHEALKALSESPDSILQKIKEGLKDNP